MEWLKKMNPLPALKKAKKATLYGVAFYNVCSYAVEQFSAAGKGKLSFLVDSIKEEKEETEVENAE